MNVEVKMKEHMVVPEENKAKGYPFKTVYQESLRNKEMHMGVESANIRVHELVSPYIISEENIIDELTSKETREKMDEAHNKMMEKKFNIYHGIKPESDSDQTGLFDDYEKYRKDVTAKHIVLQTSSLCDDEYRKSSVEFLQSVIQSAKKAQKSLDDTISDLEYEKKRAILDYDQKIRQAKKERKQFDARLEDATVSKFSYTDSVGGLTEYIDGVHNGRNPFVFIGSAINQMEIILAKAEEIQKAITEESPEELERKEILDQTKEAMKKPASFFDRITGRK